MKMILAAVFALSCLSAVRLPAQTLNWSTPAKYGTGTEPSVSMNSLGIVVEVHKSQNYNTLYYHIGKVNRSTGTVTWGQKSLCSDIRGDSVPGGCSHAEQ